MRQTCLDFMLPKRAAQHYVTVSLPIFRICTVQKRLFVPKGSVERGQV
jgi:hypothetical protein